MERIAQNAGSGVSRTLSPSPRQVQSRAVGWTCQRMETPSKGLEDNRPSPILDNRNPAIKLMDRLKEHKTAASSVEEILRALKKKMAIMERDENGCWQNIEYWKAQIEELEENREEEKEALEDECRELQGRITGLYHDLESAAEDKLRRPLGSIPKEVVLAALTYLHQAIGLRKAIEPLFPGESDWGHDKAKETLKKVIDSQNPKKSGAANPKRGATDLQVDIGAVNKEAISAAQDCVKKCIADVSKLRGTMTQSDEEYQEARKKCETNIIELENTSKELIRMIEDTRPEIEKMEAKRRRILEECEAIDKEIDQLLQGE